MSRTLYGEGFISKTFLQPFLGNLCETSKEPKEGFTKVEYKNREGQEMTKYVKKYGSISGKISSFRYRVNESGVLKIKSWELVLTDNDGDMIIQVPTATRIADRLLRTLGNIDINTELTIAIFPDKETGAAAILMKQSGINLKQFYSKETPNGIPEPKLKADGTWNWSDTEDFLYQEGIKFSDKVKNEKVDVITTKQSDDFSSVEEASDLPF